MIIKDFQLNEKIIQNYKHFLFYGPNDGLKDEIINKNFKLKNKNFFSKIEETEILKNETNFLKIFLQNHFLKTKKLF